MAGIEGKPSHFRGTGQSNVAEIFRNRFGQDIRRSGVQSEYPLHMDLLDWLAVEFQDLGWSHKKMHRLIVTSSAYRQSSHMNEWHRKNDPDNRLISRATRFRMPSMILRDWALANAGLLVSKVGENPSILTNPTRSGKPLPSPRKEISTTRLPPETISTAGPSTPFGVVPLARSICSTPPTARPAG